MARPTAVIPTAKALCLICASCQAVVGTVELTTDSEVGAAGMGGQGMSPGGSGAGGATGAGAAPTRPGPFGGGPGDDPPLGNVGPPIGMPPNAEGGRGGESGAGGVGSMPPLDTSRSVVIEEPVVELERVGVDGGEAHLGLCRNGVVIGVRTTANPSEEIFGQRLTFVEPICATVNDIPSLDAPTGASVTVVRDDSIASWAATDEFQGPPPTEVPDPRLIWIPQPETVCPETAPVLVGVSGEFEQMAPDAADSAVIRSMILECAPLVVARDGIGVVAADSEHPLVSRADVFAASGSAAYFSTCDAGQVMTQIRVDAGFWLDGFVLGCSSLRSLLVAGEACSAPNECRSAVCRDDGTCAN